MSQQRYDNVHVRMKNSILSTSMHKITIVITTIYFSLACSACLLCDSLGAYNCSLGRAWRIATPLSLLLLELESYMLCVYHSLVSSYYLKPDFPPIPCPCVISRRESRGRHEWKAIALFTTIT